MRLIPNASQAWKFLSVQVLAIVGLFDVIHPLLPAVQQYIPVTWLGYINAGGAAVAILARLIQQNSLHTGLPGSPLGAEPIPAPVVAAATPK